MLKYTVKRLLLLIPVLVGITFLSFAMMRLAGGDAVTYMYENAGTAVSQEIIDEARKEYGLDQPFLVQYGRWFMGMASGDMGTSYVSGRDVYDTFIEKLPATILLMLSSVLLTMAVSVPLGILSAVRHNKWPDRLIRFFSFTGNSMPNFFAALVLMYFLSVKLGWLPVVTSENTILSLVLPTLTLTVSMASKYTRQVRAAVLEELNKDYVMGARARGVSGKVIIWKNVMKASMVTIITLLSHNSIGRTDLCALTAAGTNILIYFYYHEFCPPLSPVFCQEQSFCRLNVLFFPFRFRIHQAKGLVRTDADAGRTAFDPGAEIALGGENLRFLSHGLSHKLSVLCIGKQRYSAERTGLHTVFAADTFLRVYDHLMINTTDRPLCTGVQTWRVLAVLALDRHTSFFKFCKE